MKPPDGPRAPGNVAERASPEQMIELNAIPDVDKLLFNGKQSL